MRVGVLLLFLPVFFASFRGEKECTVQPYRIDIHEESMLWDNTYIITQDSILISSTNRPEAITKKTGVKLTKAESAAIEGLLKQINWKTLQAEYVDKTAPADFYNYIFNITFNGATHKTHIYQYKQDEIFSLVQKINQVLTAHATGFQVGYNEGYFRNKK